MFANVVDRSLTIFITRVAIALLISCRVVWVRAVIWTPWLEVLACYLRPLIDQTRIRKATNCRSIHLFIHYQSFKCIWVVRLCGHSTMDDVLGKTEYALWGITSNWPLGLLPQPSHIKFHTISTKFGSRDTSWKRVCTFKISCCEPGRCNAWNDTARH
jgi:hypothetical protein